MSSATTEMPTAKPADFGIDSSVLDGELSDLLGSTQTGAAALIHKGRLVWEKYWPPFNAATRFDTMSIGKAFAAMAIGLLADDGLLSVDDPACKYLPEWAGDGRSRITIRHLMTMTSGLKYDYDTFAKGDQTANVLSWPQDHPPGEVWCYEQATSHALCPIIVRVSEKQPIDLLKQRVLDPIGVSNIGWMRGPNGDCLAYRSILASARDLALVGWLLHEGGNWNGRQLISREFISRMTRNDSLEANARTDPRQEDYRRRSYGWLLFTNNANIWQGVATKCFAPLGSIGNMCLVDTEKHFAFVRLSTPENDPDTDAYKSELDVTDKGTSLAWRTVLKAFQ